MIQNLPLDDIEIVSGGQQSTEAWGLRTKKFGADYFGELYARSRGIQLKRFPADWGTHGKAAGPIRNREMAEYATHLLAFPLGESKGTRNMIKLAIEKGLKVHVCELDVQ